MSYNPYYPQPHPYMAYTAAGWNPAAAPPTSAPPASGPGSAIQFGSLHPGQVEALQQYGAQPMYAYPPYAVHMMPQYYTAHPHMAAQPHGSQPHGVPPQRDGRGPRGYDPRRGGGRMGPHQHRERTNEQREGGHRETPHHKPVRESSHSGHPPPPSRSGTPTSQQTQHRETPPVHHPPPMSAGYQAQSMPTTMPMHPHAYAAQMSYYYGPHYAAPAPYTMPPPGEAPASEPPQGYHHKNTHRYQLEPSSAPVSQATTHNMPMPENVESQRATPTATSKKRLPFVNPNTHTPLEHFPSPPATQAEKSTPALTEAENSSSSKPSSPRTRKDIDKTITEIISDNRIDRPNSKRVMSKVQQTELKTGETLLIKKTGTRAPLQLTEPTRKILDPSNGSHLPKSFKGSATKMTEAPVIAPKPKEVPSVASDVLRTVESVERKLDDKTPKEVKPHPEPVETEEKNKYSTLILDAAQKKAAKAAEVVAEVVPGSRAVAAPVRTVEKKPVEVEQPQPQPQPQPQLQIKERPQQPLEPQQPKSHPVPLVVISKPPSDTPAEELEEPEKEETPLAEEAKKELPAIETKREEALSEPKTDTPSKSIPLSAISGFTLEACRNIYSPSVLLEFKEKNKEPSPDLGSGPWLEGSELDSPSTRDSLPRRNSSSKLGSRSNSYQGLSRRNSSNGRGSRQAKAEAEAVFHVSSKKRVYTTDYLMSLRGQCLDKPVFQESLQCLKDYEGAIRRTGSDRWSKPGRSGFDERKPSLSRSNSGRDWQKESGRTGNVVVGGRRMNRQFSGQGQRGTEDGKWGKTDISMLSPFAPNSTPGLGLHHTENRYVVGETQTDDPEEEKRQKVFKGLLNKLTPSNFARMYEKFTEVEITDPKTLKGLIDQIFDKALTETTFCPLYSDLCKLLTSEMPEFEEEGDRRKLTFRRLLLNKCQNEFEKGDAAVRAAEEAEKADDSTMSAEDRQSRLVAAKKERMRSLGNMQFIGFLFKKGMLTERIIHNCIVDLLSEEVNPKPEDIECLCQLLTTVGALLTSSEDVLGAYFCRIERLSKHPKLETRHKFMLLDLIEMKDRNWVERREKEGPKKIEEIHRDAQMEQMAQNSRNRGGGFRGGDFGGRSSRGSHWSRTSSGTSRPMTTFNTHEEVKPLTKNLSLGRTASSDISLRPSNIGAPKGAIVSLPRSRSPTNLPPPQQSPPIEESADEVSSDPPMDEATLSRKVKSLLDEYYNEKDMEEALDCVEELFGQNAEKHEILKAVLLCALDIRGIDVNERLKPISPLLKELLARKLFAPPDAKKGLQMTMAALPEVADEFPKAPVLIAKMLGSLVSEGIIPLKPILDPVTGIILGAGRETLQSKEDDTPLVDCGFASHILIEILKQMKSEEEGEIWVRDAVYREEADLSLFYPSYLRDDIDLSEELQFLD